MTGAAVNTGISVFFSYSHKDEDFRNELEAHLALLRRQGIISSWYDRRITAGSDFSEVISGQLDSSQIILLLVSAHFLASDYCYDREMARALEKHDEGNAVVIPVILHPCDWHSAPFGHLRATPQDGKPISMYANQHQAFAEVAKDVREVAASIAAASDSNGQVRSTKSSSTNRSQERSGNLRIKRHFDDHERDEFLEDSYEYIGRFFEGSLEELATRNPQIKTRFKRVSATSFTAAIYDSGERVAQCSVSYGEGHFGSPNIAYSHAAEVNTGSFNELLSVIDDGYMLQLEPMGMGRFEGDEKNALSQQGAAEYYWSMFIRPLQ